MYITDIDIGGTKCAVITAEFINGNITLLKKDRCATDHTIPPEKMIEKLLHISLYLCLCRKTFFQQIIKRS